MTADNKVTWDHAVLLATMIAGIEVDFTWLLLGSHAGQGFQGHNYLPVTMHDIFIMQVRRCAHLAHGSVKDSAGHY